MVEHGRKSLVSDVVVFFVIVLSVKGLLSKVNRSEATAAIVVAMLVDGSEDLVVFKVVEVARRAIREVLLDADQRVYQVVEALAVDDFRMVSTDSQRHLISGDELRIARLWKGFKVDHFFWFSMDSRALACVRWVRRGGHRLDL